jgi:uroporphyrinogen-III synthase
MTPTLILTRPLAQSESFAAQVLAAWGKPLDVVISPVLKIEMLPVVMPEVDAVIFTSANGVRATQSMTLPAGLTAWCVGDKTAALARAAGFRTQTGSGDADGLVSLLSDAHPTGTIAHIRGKHARGDISTRLNAVGVRCIDVVAYDQLPCDLTHAAQQVLFDARTVILPLFSPRSSTILSRQGPFHAKVRVIALSQAVKDALDPALGWTADVVSRPDEQAMLAAVTARLLEGPAEAG